MEKVLSDFGIDWRLLAAQVVNFLVLLFILKKLLYKPVLNLLDERKKKIEESLANAEKIQKELEETEIKRQEILDQSIEESKRIIAEAAAQGSQIIADSQSKAKEEFNSMMEQGTQMIAGEKEKMKSEVKTEVAAMIELSLEKVLGKTLDSKSHQKLVDDAVKTIKS
jgi:F-type H+-transporting ATPase subunit b